MPITKSQPAAKAAGISLNPDTYGEGGLLDDADVDIKEAAFVLWDYQGQAPQGPALGINFVDADGKEHDQYYSAGKINFFVPSEDGESLIPVGDKQGIQRTCNAAAFLLSLVNARFPKEKLDDGKISVLVGANVHVHRQAQPKRSGLAQQPRADGREATILLVDKINRLPWEKASPKGVGSAAKTTKPATAPTPPSESEASGDEVENELNELIVGLLAEEGTIPKAKLAGLVSKAVDKDNPNRKSMVSLVFRDAFLKKGPWDYSGGKLSMPE